MSTVLTAKIKSIASTDWKWMAFIWKKSVDRNLQLVVLRTSSFDKLAPLCSASSKRISSYWGTPPLRSWLGHKPKAWEPVPIKKYSTTPFTDYPLHHHVNKLRIHMSRPQTQFLHSTLSPPSSSPVLVLWSHHCCAPQSGASTMDPLLTTPVPC